MAEPELEQRPPYRGGRPPCPACGNDRSKVIDGGEHVRIIAGAYVRVRECKDRGCGQRWETREAFSRLIRKNRNRTRPTKSIPNI